SSHWRRAFPHYLDDGARSRYSRRSCSRSRRGFDRSGANTWREVGLFYLARTRQTYPGSFIAHMLPSELKPKQFRDYPPLARKFVTANLAALRRLPLSFLPSLLREAIEYDFKFPAERTALEKEIANVNSLSPEHFREWFGRFEQIRLSQKLEHFDWINSPGQFVEQLSAHLWTTHQLDAFRNAATDYGNRLHAVAPPEPPAIRRLGITVVGQGANASELPLVRKLRPHGAYFTHVNPENGLQQLLGAAAARAKAHPAPYGHWYIDGGQEAPCEGALTRV